MTTSETLSDIRDEVADASAEDVLAVAARRFPGRVAFASSLGPEDQVITHMIAEAGLADPHLHARHRTALPRDLRSDRAHHERATACPSARTSPTRADVEEMVDEHGVNLFRDSVELRKLCCDVRKVRPLRRAQADLDAWVCGLRSGQGATRQAVEPVEWDEAAGLVKINPLAAWDEDRVWEYVRANDVPYNPLHDAGLPEHRLRAVHAGRGARRGPPVRALVVGERRAPRVRPAPSQRDCACRKAAS